MTVGKLRQILANLPDDMPVESVVDGDVYDDYWIELLSLETGGGKLTLCHKLESTSIYDDDDDDDEDDE